MQCRSKGNITGGARERRRREPLGGSGGMLPQKILKARGLEMLFILYILRFSHQILLCERAFRILLRPIREAKRVSHTCKNLFVQSQTTVKANRVFAGFFAVTAASFVGQL